MKRVLRSLVLPMLLLVVASSASCERVCVVPKDNPGQGNPGGICIPA